MSTTGLSSEDSCTLRENYGEVTLREQERPNRSGRTNINLVAQRVQHRSLERKHNEKADLDQKS
jgi:hypothetical protein